MKSFILETFPIAVLVASEVFVTVFAFVWAGLSALGLSSVASITGLGLGGVATIIAVWATFRIARQTRMSEKQLSDEA